MSDIDQFAEHGGVIGLVDVGPALKFVINRDAAVRAGLHVAAGLLSLATVLDGNRTALSPTLAGRLTMTTVGLPIGDRLRGRLPEP